MHETVDNNYKMSSIAYVLKRKIFSFKDKIRYLINGDISTFLYEISACFPNCLFKYNAGALMVTSSPKTSSRKYTNYLFIQGCIDDIPEISELTGVPEPIVYKRYNAGDRCDIVRETQNGNRLVSVIWSHQGACFIKGLGLKLDIDTDSVYLYSAYTLPEARMKGIFNMGLKIIHEYYKGEGINKLYCLIEHSNRSSYNYHLKLNFKPISKIKFISILFFKFSSCKNLENGKRQAKFLISAPKDVVPI